MPFPFRASHGTVLARSQAYLSFEVHLFFCFFFAVVVVVFFPSNTDGNLSELTLWPFLVLFASSSSRRNFKSSSDNVANLDFDSAMTTLIKLLVSMLGDVTSAA